MKTKSRTPFEAVADTLRPFYQRFAGDEAPLAALPLAIVRGVRGNFVTLRIDGRPIRVDLRDVVVAGEMLFLRRYEPVETALMKKVIEIGDTVVDVGANIGYFTILMAQCVGPTGSVIAIEPDDENALVLDQNIALHEIGPRVEVVRAAVSDSSGPGILYRSSRNRGDHRMWRPSGDEPQRETRTPRVVETRTLDSILAGRGPIDFMKIDIQGHEPKAVGGLSARLNGCRISTMLFEFWPYGLRGAGFDPRRLLEDLWAYGMQTWHVQSTGLVRIESLDFVDGFHGSQDANLFAANPSLATAKIARLGL
jgi:FkbM family methyltransferase